MANSNDNLHLDELGVPIMVPAEAPPQSKGVPLLPATCEEQQTERWHRVGEEYIVRNVSYPTLTPFLPDPALATGTAVIVAPGGGFTILAIGHEGWSIAQRLAERGIAAFVLKYRVAPSPEDDADFVQMLRDRMAGILEADDEQKDELGKTLSEPNSTEDALAAVRSVRTNAAQWGIDPKKVGLMGFSAGAIVAVNAAIEAGSPDRPNFIAPFYPSMERRVVPADAPAMFAALAFDDMYFADQGLGLIEGWKKAGRPVEFHGFQSGGHGFGLGKPGTSSALIFEQFELWMRTMGFLVGTD